MAPAPGPRKYGPFPYSAIIDRPKLVWPNGKRLAVWVCPNIEFYPLDSNLEPGRKAPNIFPWSMRDYGNRVAVFRIMEVLAERNIRASVCLNSDICAEHPRIIEEGEKLKWEWMGHCESNSRPTFDMGADEERDTIIRVVDTIKKATGRAPAGWLGAGGGETWSSTQSLVEAGIRYTGDWVNDDQPYMIETEKGPLVSLPYSVEVNDARQINRRDSTSDDFLNVIKRQFDTLYKESAHTGKVMCIAIHPWLVGVPHRIHALEEGLDYIRRHEDVWFATGTEIMDAYLAQAR